MGTLLRSCAKVREPMELSFEVVSGVGHTMGELEEVHMPQGEGSFEDFVLRLFWGMNKHFQAKRAKYSNVHTMETTAWIPTKFCTPVKTSKYVSWVVQKRGQQIQDGGRLDISCLAHFWFWYTCVI